ncbi:MAG: hypothetical protein ACK4S4_07045 [Pyrinomonadaceae bacterium]
MKYCPTCDRRYDEEIMRFCTKDGTPLVDEEQPKFVAMPSDRLADEMASDEPDEVTVVRRGAGAAAVESLDSSPQPRPRSGDRIVIPTYDDRPAEPRSPSRTRAAAAYYPPPARPNTFKIVVLTIIATLAVLGLGLAGFWMLQGDRAANRNANVNVNTNANLNAGFDANVYFNGATPTVSATKTPTPTPKPSPSPSESPSPTATPTPERTATPTPERTATPTPPPTPRPSPTDGRPRVTTPPPGGPAGEMRPSPPRPPANRPR